MKSEVRLPEFYSKRLRCKNISTHQVFWSAQETIVIASLIGQHLVGATSNPGKRVPKKWYARGPRELVITGDISVQCTNQRVVYQSAYYNPPLPKHPSEASRTNRRTLVHPCQNNPRRHDVTILHFPHLTKLKFN